MTLSPIKRFSIDTKSLTGGKQNLFTAIEQEYGIKIKGEEFKISRWYGRGIEILIIGQIKDSSVDLTIRPSYITIAFFPIFLSVGICMFFMTKGIKDIRFLLLICGILAVVYGYILFMIKRLSEKFEEMAKYK